MNNMKFLINLFDKEKLKFEKFSHGQYSSSSAEIAQLWGSNNLGFHFEILDPGAFSCPYHFHHEEEELFLVLKGKALVRQDDEFYEIKEGDLVFFKSGSAHQFYNNTKEAFLFLALSDKSPDEVCEYPDSSKRWERANKKLTLNGVEVNDYWLGEEDPRSKWPKELLEVPTNNDNLSNS